MTRPSARPAPDPTPSAPGAPTDAAARACAHLIGLQRPGGEWEGEMVWNTMITSQYAIVRVLLDGVAPLDAKTRAGLARHLTVCQRADGSFGMHPESGGYVFFTTLAYVALRLLGHGSDDHRLRRARAWLHGNGGVAANPTWGKCWLALLGLYGWEGTNPCPPELFLLPRATPIHPRNYYCHTRNIYAALAFLWGSRARFELPAGMHGALMAELYDGAPPDDFRRHRRDVAKADLHVPLSRGLRLAFDALAVVERLVPARLRRRALDDCFERILFEQRTSARQCVSPVNGLLSVLAIHARGLADGMEHAALRPAIAGLEAWRFEDEAEGVRFAGARSQTWDTAFALQALAERPRDAEVEAALARGVTWLAGAQLLSELPVSRSGDRDPARGGFCFSDGVHAWPVSDCTAEALSAFVALRQGPRAIAASPLPRERMVMAVDFLLSRQNGDGGFGSYERARGGRLLLERCNPTELFGACMTERSYVECTASCVAALADIFRHEPDALDPRRRRTVRRAIDRGAAFLRASQRDDGAFHGFWGIHATYGTFHAVRGLRAAGLPVDDPALLRAAAWLVDRQRDDGGWGERYTSCLEDRYVPHDESQVVQTSWAVLALLDVLGPRAGAVERGVAFLARRQRADGGYATESPNGVFFGSAMLDYRLYRATFPAWALARYERLARAA